MKTKKVPTIVIPWGTIINVLGLAAMLGLAIYFGFFRG